MNDRFDSSPDPSQPESVPPPPAVVQRQLADAMPIIVWTNAEDGELTYLNATWHLYTGVAPEESLREGVRSFVHPDDIAEIERRAAHARETGAEGYEGLYRVRRRDGVYRWHQARVRRVEDARGKHVTWVGTAMDVDDERRAHVEQTFLVEATEALGASLDPKATLNDVAHLVVPRLADWCAVDLVGEGGLLDRAAVAHVDPTKVAKAWELWRRLPPQPTDPAGAYGVLRTRTPELQREDPDAMIAAAITDPELLALFRALALKSWIIVPLVARDRVFGTLTLVSAESARPYEERDVLFASELARRIAMALENARLYDTARELAKREAAARAVAEAIAADVVQQGRAVENALLVMREERDAARAELAELTRGKARP